ncbi:MAG: PmoA family protein [Pedobacter sp.]|nr:PmoA family protein [Pedobacter sp.]MDQ8053496.1 PmoA family protein [Pedobacter sp.]
MRQKLNSLFACLGLFCTADVAAQKQAITFNRHPAEKKIDILVGNKMFTSFLYTEKLEKPVLFPVLANHQVDVTRGFPLQPKNGDPTDHPHHIGIWFNFENLNGLDFWNNSYAIPAEKKSAYGWIKTDPKIETDAKTGVLAYRARWTNQKDETLLIESTKLTFNAAGDYRIIDRETTLTASTAVTFTDAKDGMLAIRLAHELQIPTDKDQKFTDDKGNVTLIKGGTDLVANGNYLTSIGKTGDAAWSTRASWCMAFGKMGNDSVSVIIIDHPKNINYPTYWHARGYGLFAANPLGEKIFTNGASAKNLQLKKGESATFRFRIVVNAGPGLPSPQQIEQWAAAFAKK